MTPFDDFIAIDWSGQAVERPRGLAVARCQAGTASCARVRRTTDSIMRFFATSSTRASHSPSTPSNSRTSAPSPSRMTLPR